jgi:hypothetical protein
VKIRYDAVRSLTGKPRTYPVNSKVSIGKVERERDGTRTTKRDYRVLANGALELRQHLEEVHEGERQLREQILDRRSQRSSMVVHADGARTYERTYREDGAKGPTPTHTEIKRIDPDGRLSAESRLSHKNGERQTTVHHRDGSKTWTRSELDVDAEGLQPEQLVGTRTTPAPWQPLLPSQHSCC